MLQEEKNNIHYSRTTPISKEGTIASFPANALYLFKRIHIHHIHPYLKNLTTHLGGPSTSNTFEGSSANNIQKDTLKLIFERCFVRTNTVDSKVEFARDTTFSGDWFIRGNVTFGEFAFGELLLSRKLHSEKLHQGIGFRGIVVQLKSEIWRSRRKKLEA